MGNNVVSLNLKSSSSSFSVDKVTTNNNVINPNLNDIKLSNESTSYEAVDNFNSVELVEKEYTYEELLKEAQEKTTGIYSKSPLYFFQDDVTCPAKEKMDEYIRNCQKAYFEGSKFDAYKIFRDCLVQDKFVSKPLRDSRYATQGCGDINGVCCITSYDTQYVDPTSPNQDEKKKSVLSLADFAGMVKNLFLDTYGHVGGFAYHEGSNKAYIPGEYTVIKEDGKQEKIKFINIYDANQFAEAKNGAEITPERKISLQENNYGVSTASYLTVHNDNLFVGVFKENDYGKINKYDIDEHGNLVYDSSITPPIPNVQGMCLFEYNNTEYYVFSSSLGRTNDSILYIGTLNEDGTFKETTTIDMPCMSEQVSVDKDGDLMIVFESDCIKYGDGADKGGSSKAKTQVGNVCYLDIDKIMSTVNS